MEQHRDVLERPQACAALSALLAFTELTADATGLGKYTLQLHDPGRCGRARFMCGVGRRGGGEVGGGRYAASWLASYPGA